MLGYVQDGGQRTSVKELNAGHLAVADQPLLLDLVRDELIVSRGEE